MSPRSRGASAEIQPREMAARSGVRGSVGLHGGGPVASKPDAVTPPRGLVYHSGALGDFVLSLPAVFRVTEANPKLSWDLWGPKDRLALLPGFRAGPPELQRWGHTLWGSAPAPEALAALSRFGVILAFGGRTSPDWAVPPGPRVLRLASFPSRGGAWVPVHQAGQLAAQQVPPPRKPWLPRWRDQVLPRRERREIVLHPGSGDPRKNLPHRIWAETLALLTARSGLPCTLVLGPAEQERGGWETLIPAVGSVQICSRLPDLLAALSRARLFLGNDSGATHLAAALGIPTVAAFGPSDPRLWHPLGPQVRVAEGAYTCAPCSAGEPIACPVTACLDDLSASTVADAGAALLLRVDEARNSPV